MKLNDQTVSILCKALEAGLSVVACCGIAGISESTFYRWRQAFERMGDAGLLDKKPIPKSHPNATPTEVVEKVLHLRRRYHLGPIRIVWYLDRYHGVRVSGAGVYRILKRHGSVVDKSQVHDRNSRVDRDNLLFGFPLRLTLRQVIDGHSGPRRFPHVLVEERLLLL